MENAVPLQEQLLQDRDGSCFTGTEQALDFDAHVALINLIKLLEQRGDFRRFLERARQSCVGRGIGDDEGSERFPTGFFRASSAS
jgi:hypothetical protein